MSNDEVDRLLLMYLTRKHASLAGVSAQRIDERSLRLMIDGEILPRPRVQGGGYQRTVAGDQHLAELLKEMCAG